MRPALHVENGQELGCLWLLHRAGISGRQIGAVACPRPCTRRPCRHHPAFRRCGSERWFGQSWSRGMLGGMRVQVNERRVVDPASTGWLAKYPDYVHNPTRTGGVVRTNACFQLAISPAELAPPKE